MKAKYNKSVIMKRAWKLFKAQEIRTMEMFSDCLRQSWNIAKNGIAINDINTIYHKYYKQVYYFILGKVNNQAHIAEELTNDVFMKAKEHLEKYDVYLAKLNTWLFTIAKNTVIDHFRTAHADKYISVDNFVDSETGRETFQIADNNETDNVENDELSTAIQRAMYSLKPKYRRIAELFFMEQKKYDEIAEILDIPMGSVKGMINRVRAMLQESLQGVRTA
jgi:RNA polymerase sigma-70 factor (ECF subfamily)